MKKIIVSLAVCTLALTGYAQQSQINKSVKDIQVLGLNENPAGLPLIGQKVITIIYVDPDKRDINEPLYNAIIGKKYPKEKYGMVAVINTKDTWIPTSAIRSGAKKNQEKSPEPILMLDEKRTLATALALGDCNNAIAIIIVGRDGKTKIVRIIKSQDDSRAAIQPVLRVIDEELAK